MDIEIGAIELDVGNFRHAKVSHERDAMRLLLGDEQEHGVTDLARDIVTIGSLDPSSRLIVMQKPEQSDRYIALEGNRRITALKTLMTPEIAEGLSCHPTFRKLSSEFMALNITTVDCVVLDRKEAAKWIKRKHYKGMGGEAVQQWNAVATARSDASEGIFTRWMTSLAYLENHGINAEILRDQIAGKTTTVERVLTSAQIPAMLGLNYDRSGTVTPQNGDTDGAVKLIKKMLDAMAQPTFRETLVSNKDQQKQWLQQFEHLNVKINEDDENLGSKNAEPGKSKDGSETTSSESERDHTQGGNGDSGKSGGPDKRSRTKPAKDRKVLAEKGLPISNPNLNKFYGELRRLNVSKNPFISAALIRIFLEKATVEFLEEMEVPPLDTRPGATWHDFGTKLRTKVDAALHQIDPEEANPKLQYARDVANGNQDRLHSLDELNRAIHDHTALPSWSEILIIWDRFHPYFLALFETIENSRN